MNTGRRFFLLPLLAVLPSGLALRIAEQLGWKFYPAGPRRVVQVGPMSMEFAKPVCGERAYRIISITDPDGKVVYRELARDGK